MKKRYNLITVISLMLLVSVVTFLCMRQMALFDMQGMLDQTLEQQESTKLFADARKTILDNYIGDIDEETLNEGAVRGMIAALDDQWSAYLTPEQYQQQTSNDNSFVGIGITALNQAEAVLVSEVYKGSPADLAGMQTGDIITAVDGASAAELGYDETVSRIRGEENTLVTVTVLRGTQSLSLTMTRSTVTRQMVLSDNQEGDVGYIRILGFDSRVDADFTEAVRRLQETGIQALVLDVRDNPGGSVTVMCEMLDLLLPAGRLITLQSKNGVEEHKQSSASFLELPLAILINENSYSAAEFFAACLTEYSAMEDNTVRAFTVGAPTTGKGYAQRDLELTDGSGLHLSVLRYFTPGGVSLAGIGLTPDYPVAMTGTISYSDHENDPQFQKAVALLRETLYPAEATDIEEANP